MLGLMERHTMLPGRAPSSHSRLIAAANSRTGRRTRILGGTLAVLARMRLRGWIGAGLAVAGALAAIPALWGFCL
jgi:hypothetical protein